LKHPERDIDASDWTEQDLLTRGLAVQRLAADEADTLAELDALRNATATDPDAIAALERRLRALGVCRANLVAAAETIPVSDNSAEKHLWRS
jgi:hypothetical protein